MKIGFEAKRLFTNYTGLGNYSRFIVGAMSSHDPLNEYFLFTPREVINGEVKAITDRENVRVVKPSGVFKAFSSLWRSWGLSTGKIARGINIFHGLNQELPFGLPDSVKKVVTVHDLIFLRYPAFYNAVDVSIYKTKVRSACLRADKVIAISEQTAQDIVDFLNIERRKIDVVYQGCHPDFKKVVTQAEKERIKATYNLPDRYILNVGTIEKRKNIIILIDALALLPKSAQLPLVIMGRKSPYMQKVIERARQRDVLDKIFFLHDARFQDFPAIYQQATMFVYPSLFEGFGIPLVEAIASNIPVITSRGSCFLETAGPDALYIDPLQAEDLAEKFQMVIRGDSQTKEGIEKSRRYIGKFEPEIIARQLSEVYRSLLRL